jgi:hypothetical protein
MCLQSSFVIPLFSAAILFFAVRAYRFERSRTIWNTDEY